MTPDKTATDKEQIYLYTFRLYQPWFDSETSKSPPRVDDVKKKTVCIFFVNKSFSQKAGPIDLLDRWQNGSGENFLFSIWSQHWGWEPTILSGVAQIHVLLQKSSLSAQRSELLVPLDLLCSFICPAGVDSHRANADSFNRKYLEIPNKQVGWRRREGWWEHEVLSVLYKWQCTDKGVTSTLPKPGLLFLLFQRSETEFHIGKKHIKIQLINKWTVLLVVARSNSADDWLYWCMHHMHV